jgi:energy-coupling factor transporter transmembrane protein EcfT
MTKKAHMVLFMFAATVFNIILTLICLSILVLLYSVFLVQHIPENKSFIGFPLIFLASLVLSYIIYQKFLKLYLKKHPEKNSQ